MTSRLLLAVVCGAFLALCACQALTDSVRGDAPMAALNQAALSIVDVEPRLGGSVSALISSLSETLDPDGALPSSMAGQLDADLRRFTDAIDELRWRRNRFKKCGSSVTEDWSAQTAFLPPGHAWREPGTASEHLGELQQQLNELDSLLLDTESSMMEAAGVLRAPLAVLAQGTDDEVVDTHRALLEAGLEALLELPAQLSADAARLRDFAKQLTRA